jgi:hypothetical protein
MKMTMKKIVTRLLALVLTLSLTTTAFAVVYPANGDNISYDTAQELLRTTQTPAEFYAGNTTNQHVAVGTLSPGQEHWYKIFLPANSQTILGMTTWELSADIFDSNLTFISTEYFIRDPMKTTPIPKYVDIQTSGYYYIRLYGAVSTNEYRVYMGGPTYLANSYVHNDTTMTLTPTVSSQQKTINLTNVAAIPIGAIVHTISMSGTKTGTVSSEKRGMKHATDSAFTTKTFSPWEMTYSFVQNKTAKSSWTFQWSGTVKTGNTSTLVPQITFRYVYPLTPENY